MPETAVNKIRILLSVIFMACLILIAPCKVRNFLESSLGAEQSSVLNKSKATVQSTCIYAHSDRLNVQKTIPVRIAPDISVVFNPNTPTNILVNSIKPEGIPLRDSFIRIPYYILHQNFKGFL